MSEVLCIKCAREIQAGDEVLSLLSICENCKWIEKCDILSSKVKDLKKRLDEEVNDRSALASENRRLVDQIADVTAVLDSKLQEIEELEKRIRELEEKLNTITK